VRYYRRSADVQTLTPIAADSRRHNATINRPILHCRIPPRYFGDFLHTICTIQIRYLFTSTVYVSGHNIIIDNKYKYQLSLTDPRDEIVIDRA